jgi:hypothetical protein
MKRSLKYLFEVPTPGQKIEIHVFAFKFLLSLGILKKSPVIYMVT